MATVDTSIYQNTPDISGSILSLVMMNKLMGRNRDGQPNSNPFGVQVDNNLATDASTESQQSEPPAAAPQNGIKIYQKLLQRGIAPVQAAALAGNWQQESGFDPGAWNAKEGAGGMGQWRLDRLDALKKYAASKGTNWTDPDTQIDFALNELHGSEKTAGAKFFSAKDVASANAALKSYIRYGDNSEGTRLGYAKAFAAQPTEVASNDGGYVPTQTQVSSPSSPDVPVPTPRPDTMMTNATTTAGQTDMSSMSDDDLLNAYSKPAQEGTPATTGGEAASPSADMSDDSLLKAFTGTPEETKPPSSTAKAIPANIAAASTSEQNAEGGVGTATAVSGGIVSGIPVVGPLLEGGAQRAAAAIRSYLYDTPYQDELKAVQEYDTQARAAHPVVETGGKIAGAILGTAPLVAAAPGAFGLGAGSLAARSGAAAMSGGALGAADSAMRSKGTIRSRAEQTIAGGFLGGVLGAAAPGAGQAMGWVGNKLIGLVRSPSPTASAARNMISGVEMAGQTPQEIGARLAQNPSLAPMDVSDPLLVRGLGIATQPNQTGRQILSDAVKARVESAPLAVQTSYDAALGKVPNVKTLVDDLANTAKINARRGFSEALDNAKPVDVSNVISRIDEIVNPGITGKVTNPGSALPPSRGEQMLLRLKQQITNGKEQLTDPQKLHQIQTRLRVQADTLAKSANGEDRLIASDLRDVRQSLIDSIDAASGGKYRPAQAQYADDMSIRSAFDKGLSIFKNRSGETGIEDRPEFWQSWLQEHQSPEELQALKQGVRVAVDQSMQSVRNAALKGETLPEIGFNKDKLALIVGNEQAEKIAQQMADFRQMSQSNALLMSNSKTALAQESRKAVEMPQPPSFGNLSRNTAVGMATALPMKAGGAGINRVMQAYANARNATIARAISEGGGGQFNQLMQNVARERALRAAAARGLEVGTNMLVSRGVPRYVYDKYIDQSKR